ncbi:MAG: hypothetical protein LBB36_05155 [Fibromonadaceae bacterium]|jgi:hypothetical protein|nr:hypothetical protein [Fibromonadaceae bacterium]
MKKSTLTLTAVALAAMAFTACGGSKPPSISEVAKNGEVEVTTPRSELTELAQSEYKDHFWGIGDAPSTREQVAAQQAELNARAALATFMNTQIEARAKQSTLNSADGNAVEVFMQRLNQSTNEMIANSQIRKSRTMYDKANNQYHVYVLVSVPRDAAYGSLKNKLSGEQALTDVIMSKAIMDFIDAELDKGTK